MIDRLTSSGAPAPMHVDKSRQSGRGFADWLERERRATVRDDGVQSDALAASNMTGQIAQRDAGFPDVEIRLRGAAGELETIALPWKLAANGSLSHRLLQQASAGLADSAAGAGAASAATQVPGSASISTRLPQQAHDWRQMNAFGSLLPPQTPTAVDIESIDASSPSAMHARAAMPWLLRLFRWLEHKGHDPSIWLRDYRLDQTDAHQLVDALRAHASEQGIRLERIVVNGHELWRAPTPLAMESTDAR